MNSNKIEKSLYDMLHAYWKQKWLMIAIVFGCTVVGLIYIKLSKPVYEARAGVVLPKFSNIDIFTYLENPQTTNKSTRLTINKVYKLYIRELLSDKVRHNFFNQVYLPSLPLQEQKETSRDTLYKKLSKFVLIREVPGTISKKHLIVVRREEPAQAVQWAKAYINFANEAAIQDVRNILNIQNQNHLRHLENKINMAREITKHDRLDRLVQLKEAINVAKASRTKNQSSGMSSIGDAKTNLITVLSDPALMYLRGTKALDMEIKNLSERPSDDPFVPHLRQMQEEYNLYEKIGAELSNSNVIVFDEDGDVFVSNKPVSPNSILIMSLAILIGLLLGASVATLRNFIKVH